MKKLQILLLIFASFAAGFCTCALPFALTGHTSHEEPLQPQTLTKYQQTPETSPSPAVGPVREDGGE